MDKFKLAMLSLLVIILALGIPHATTTSTTSSTSTTMSQDEKILNGTSAAGIGGLFFSGFDIIPFFALLLVLLAGGIALVRSKKVSIGFLVALVVAVLLTGIGTLIGAAVINPAYTLIIAGIFSGIVLYEILVKHETAFSV